MIRGAALRLQLCQRRLVGPMGGDDDRSDDRSR